MSRKIDTARRLRPLIVRAAASLPNEIATDAVELFPRLKGDGSLVRAGTRINWNGTIKRAAADLWDTAQNTPDAAPTLWEDIKLIGEYREIPEVITAGLAFALGECGWWKGVLYRSKIAANVYTPAAYPAGWEVVV